MGMARLMSEPTESLEPPPIEDALRTSVNFAYDRAKRWAGGLLALQGFLFVGSITAMLAPALTLTYPWVALPLAALNTFVALRASRIKGVAEDAKRRHEYFEAFGETPSARWLADFRMVHHGRLPETVEALLRQGITYASSKVSGPERAMEMLSESAWYSRHLAAWCATALAILIAVSLTLALAILLYLLASLGDASAGEVASRAIAGTLLLLVSLGVVRNYTAYAGFSKKSEKTDEAASALLESGREIDHFDAQRLFAEYQLARAGTPLIPTWVWKINRHRLNENYSLKHT